MAVEGRYGTLELKREWGMPTAVGTQALAGDAITLDNQSFWRGDRVLLMSQRGIPIVQSGDTYARCPDGYSFYDDGVFDTGPAVAARTAGDQFYAASDSAAFYETDIPTAADVYCHMSRDDLDDCQFYDTEMQAWNSRKSDRLEVANVDFGSLLFVPAPSGFYNSDLVAQGVAGLPTDIANDGEIGIDEFWPVDVRAQITEILEAQTEASDWKCVASLTGWVFEMNTAVLDQTAIGERFGEAVKGLLRGAGSVNAFMDNSSRDKTFDSSSLLKLTLMTEEGSKAKARFRISANNSKNKCNDASLQSVSSTLYYLADILFSKSSVNIAATEAITISAEFVSTGTCKIGTDMDR